MYFTRLKNRGLITVTGPDRHDFLQGLISNDIRLLEQQPCIYACLLSPQGKFLHDFFITAESGALKLECEGGDRAADLYRRLSLYRLRAQVEIAVEEEIAAYAIIPPADGGDRGEDFYPDPRHPAMGFRSFTKPDGFEERPFAAWDEHRIRLTVPDGSRDMTVNSSTLLECNIDRLNGIAWDKGCYVGQELTARMHYRGLAKKHLYALESESPLPAPGSEIRVSGKLIGEMRSSCGNAGLALLKDEAVDKLKLIGIKTL